MKMWNALLVLVGSFFLPVVRAALEEDYIQSAPPTIYESGDPTDPQTMDFDIANNMFIAHSGWYNNREIHYYKFRMYTPTTYPGVIGDKPNFGDIPIQKLFITTTSGDLSGAIGNPIIEFHTVDGTNYTDFVEIHFVTVSSDYVADTYKSTGDIAGLSAVDSGMVVNMPVVPTDSKLQDPAQKGTNVAPITATPVWYKGVTVHTYVFEVTDDAAKEHFSSTRSDPTDLDFSITTINFANAEVGVFAIPLWHFNQYTRGVTESNAGGPNPAGMRNLINLDRADAGYSPLWEINWMTQLPVNYQADQVSDSTDLLQDNGFFFVKTPMFVNCPNVGKVGEEENPARLTTYQSYIDTELETNWIQGSDASLIFKGGVQVTVKGSDGTIFGTVDTNGMGAYEFELQSSLVAEQADLVDVVVNGDIIHAVNIGEDEKPTNAPTGPPSTANTFVTKGLGVILVVLLVLL